jgi:hypothetical protein
MGSHVFEKVWINFNQVNAIETKLSIWQWLKHDTYHGSSYGIVLYWWDCWFQSSIRSFGSQNQEKALSKIQNKLNKREDSCWIYAISEDWFQHVFADLGLRLRNAKYKTNQARQLEIKTKN